MNDVINYKLKNDRKWNGNLEAGGKGARWPKKAVGWLDAIVKVQRNIQATSLLHGYHSNRRCLGVGILPGANDRYKQ